MTGQSRILGTIAGILAVAGACAAAIAAAPAGAASSSAPRACSAANTQVWLGVGNGGGYAGGYGVPLEFSNIGKRSCTLYGYPGVSAYRGAQKQIGPAATRISESHAVVTLAPGGTAYAFLRVADSGAVCGRSGVSADGLTIYAPGQRAARTIAMPVTVCARVAVLAVGAVRAGAGIPGYITE